MSILEDPSSSIADHARLKDSSNGSISTDILACYRGSGNKMLKLLWFVVSRDGSSAVTKWKRGNGR